MSTKQQIISCTKNFSKQIKELKKELETADGIIVGAGSGLSTASGLTYDGQRFQQYFSDFEAEYGVHDMYSAGFYPYPSLDIYWAYWSRHIYYNRYDQPPGKPYLDLLKILREKNYFVITTNVDHQFQLAGFEKSRLFYTQGDYGLWQCSIACHPKTYDNESAVRSMIVEQKNRRIPQNLIPYCPICGKPMAMNLRIDSTFVQDQGWYEARNRYADFVNIHQEKHVVFWELGVGNNTPGIIKYPFRQMTFNNRKATYACINVEEASCPLKIQSQTLCIHGDLGDVLAQILE